MLCLLVVFRETLFSSSFIVQLYLKKKKSHHMNLD